MALLTHSLFVALLQRNIIPSTTHLHRNKNGECTYTINIAHPRALQLRYTFNQYGYITALTATSAYGDVTDDHRLAALSATATYRVRNLHSADEVAELTAQLIGAALNTQPKKGAYV